MAQLVCSGAIITCTFGLTPAPLTVIPAGAPVQTSTLPAANVSASQPMVNIPSFGMCSCLANPEVAAATTAAQGVLTPMPCVPATGTPWIPGSAKVQINGLPALTSTCQCQCLWGGIISVSFPGQVSVSE
jgi:hypothetical protein